MPPRTAHAVDRALARSSFKTRFVLACVRPQVKDSLLAAEADYKRRGTCAGRILEAVFAERGRALRLDYGEGRARFWPDNLLELLAVGVQLDLQLLTDRAFVG